MKKTILSLLIIFIYSSCSHLGKARNPSSFEGNCFSVLGEVYNETAPSHRALTKLSSMEVEIGNAEKTISFEEYLSELRENVLVYDDQELHDSWMSLMSSFQQYKFSGGSFDSFRTNWEGYKTSFFQKWRAAEKRELLKNSDEVSKIEKEAVAVVKELKVEEIETLELISRRSSIIQGIWAKAMNGEEVDKKELTDFTYWLFSRNDMDDYDSVHVYDNINKWLKDYREVSAQITPATRKNMIVNGKKNLLTLHNQITQKLVDEISSPEELKKQSLIYIEIFSLLEPKFNQENFTKYLINGDFFSDESLAYYRSVRKAEGIDVDLGMMLREQYQKFAPYQDNPPAVNKSFAQVTVERTRDLWDKLSKGQKSCADLDCYNKQATNGWFEIFKTRTYKKAFSCLQNNPVVLKSMLMDLGIVWGGLTWYYLENPDSFQRFPMEVMINGAAFAPIMAEANCRSTFKGDLALGTQIPEKEVITNALTRTNRVFKKLRGVAFKGFLSSVGLLSLTNGIDHLFLALGHRVATPLSLNDMAVLLPISFLYHGVWLGVKNMAIMNPIRHKVLPRLAEAIAKKTGLSKAYWPLQTGLDFGAYHAFATIGKYDYLIFYSAVLLPFIKDHFSVGSDIEHKEELIREDVIEHTYTGVDESGVETEVVLIEDKNGIPESGVIDMPKSNDPMGDRVSEEVPRGTIEVKSVEVNVPDNVLDSWADQILSGLPED